jgi:hypothetical protein
MRERGGGQPYLVRHLLSADVDDRSYRPDNVEHMVCNELDEDDAHQALKLEWEVRGNYVEWLGMVPQPGLVSIWT